jgi:hypothetical protein
MLGSPVNEAYAECEAIAYRRTLATRPGDFADGYRCAAREIATAIRAKSRATPPTLLERELRDVEVEARTLARVVSAAAAVVVDAGCRTPAAEAVRRLLAEFFVPLDLPLGLRPTAAVRRAPSGQVRYAVRRATMTP